MQSECKIFVLMGKLKFFLNIHIMDLYLTQLDLYFNRFYGAQIHWLAKTMFSRMCCDIAIVPDNTV